MKLYTFHRSSAAYRVRIALAIKGVRYESVPRAFARNEHRSEDYLNINPYGLIPALQTDEGILLQSLAIIEYLDEAYPEPALLPVGAYSRAVARSMALAISCDVHPLNNLRVLKYLKGELGHDDERVNAWYRHWVTLGLAGLERQVRRHSSGGQYCFGDRLSIADLSLVPQMFNAKRFGVDVSAFPTLDAVSSHLEAIPAFVAAHPEMQPDAT